MGKDGDEDWEERCFLTEGNIVGIYRDTLCLEQYRPRHWTFAGLGMLQKWRQLRLGPPQRLKCFRSSLLILSIPKFQMDRRFFDPLTDAYFYHNADGSKYFSNADGSKFYDPGASRKGRKWYQEPGTNAVRHYIDREPQYDHPEYHYENPQFQESGGYIDISEEGDDFEQSDYEEELMMHEEGMGMYETYEDEYDSDDT